MAANAVSFFYWPQVWIGELPFKEWEMLSHPKEGEDTPETELLEPSLLGEEVFRKKLKCGISVKVLRQGSFHFDFSDWEPGKIEDDKISHGKKMEKITNRLLVINTYLVLLYYLNSLDKGPYLRKLIITPKELQTTSTLDNEKSRSFTDPFTHHLFDLKSRKTTFHLTDWRLSQNKVAMRTINNSFRTLDNITINNDLSRLAMFDLMNRSYKAYEELDFNKCLVNCWIIIEQILSNLWEIFIKNNKIKKINGKEKVVINRSRKDRLMRHDIFTASVKLEILTLTNVLPFELFDLIDTVRKARNKWMHSMEDVDNKKAYEAIRTVEAMQTFFDGINIKIPVQYLIIT